MTHDKLSASLGLKTTGANRYYWLNHQTNRQIGKAAFDINVLLSALATEKAAHEETKLWRDNALASRRGFIKRAEAAEATLSRQPVPTPDGSQRESGAVDGSWLAKDMKRALASVEQRSATPRPAPPVSQRAEEDS